MRRSLASAAIAVAAVLSVPATLSAPMTAHAAEPEAQEVPLPFLWARSELHDVAVTGPDDVWAAGVQGVFCLPYYEQCVIDLEGNPVVRRWTGTSWTGYPLNGWTGNGPIEHVTSAAGETAAGETWIAGRGRTGDVWQGYVARFDGSSFQKVATPSGRVERISTGAAGTWLAERAAVWTGRHSLYKRTGSTWTGVELPAEIHTITDVQARTATDVWLVGARAAEAGTPGRLPAAAHFDGTSWTGVPPPELPADVEDHGFVKVVPVGPDDVWAITTEFLTHWDGDDWTVVRIPEESWRSRDLVVDASGVPWVAMPASPSYLFRYVDGAWQDVPTAAVGLHAIAAVPGTSTIWGAGAKGNDAAAVRTS
ncbi:hypothetical protein [Actinomadura sp. 7K507]|uniref:hypothetical protein n=1 Tax=Actinomadura sp. 7K507 TaxID=2530365 RepID=UPI001049D200|nr:hypothetical protein [Actinomadura sp. 7K507]TDC90782.1 hypothetical protein E1285_14240 [Actinomadura sp. 7K507]